jgi:hypothetical protein
VEETMNEMKEGKSILETKTVENWRNEPTSIVLKDEIVIIELVDEFKTLFIEGQDNLSLDGCRENKYFLKSKQGLIPETLIMINIIGRNILFQLQEGNAPNDASIWVMMNNCSCHLILSNIGQNYRKYVLLN